MVNPITRRETYAYTFYGPILIPTEEYLFQNGTSGTGPALN